MWPFLTKLLTKLDDPIIITLLAIIGGLFYLIVRGERTIGRLIDRLETNEENNARISKVFERLVLGKLGNGNKNTTAQEKD